MPIIIVRLDISKNYVEVPLRVRHIFAIDVSTSRMIELRISTQDQEES